MDRKGDLAPSTRGLSPFSQPHAGRRAICAVSVWRPGLKKGDGQYSGAFPFSQPRACGHLRRIARSHLGQIRPPRVLRSRPICAPVCSQILDFQCRLDKRRAAESIALGLPHSSGRRIDAPHQGLSHPFQQKVAPNREAPRKSAPRKSAA